MFDTALLASAAVSVFKAWNHVALSRYWDAKMAFAKYALSSGDIDTFHTLLEDTKPIMGALWLQTHGEIYAWSYDEVCDILAGRQAPPEEWITRHASN